MKKILLISDTHDYLDPKLLNHIQEADEVWHAGDIGSINLCKQISQYKSLIAVSGNIDGQDIRTAYPEMQVFYCEQLKVMMIHIAGYPGKFSAAAKKLIKEHQPRLFIAGHSHILKVMFDKENNLLFINPGACGISGFHQVKTAVKFEVEGSEIKNLAVIELGKRAQIITHGT